LYTFLTSKLDGDEWSISRAGSFPPGRKDPHVHIEYGTGWATEPAWTRWRIETYLHCPCQESNPGRTARSQVNILIWLYPTWIKRSYSNWNLSSSISLWISVIVRNLRFSRGWRYYLWFSGLLHPENEGSMGLRNTGIQPLHYMVQHPRRLRLV